MSLYFSFLHKIGGGGGIHIENFLLPPYESPVPFYQHALSHVAFESNERLNLTFVLKIDLIFPFF